MEEAIVVADDERGFTFGFQRRKNLCVKDVFEQRVLVGRPFVEEIEWPVFEIGSQQGKALALALRKRSRRECAIPNLDLAIKVQLLEIAIRIGIDASGFQTEKVLEEEKIREHRGEELAVFVAVLLGNRPAIEQNLTAFRRIQAGNDL